MNGKSVIQPRSVAAAGTGRSAGTTRSKAASFPCGLLLAALALSVSVQAQQAPPSQATAVPSSHDERHGTLLYRALIPAPPAAGTFEGDQDLVELHRLQASRTPAQVLAAQTDDHDESIFAFRTILGPDFVAANFPHTAKLSLRLRKQSAAVNPELKEFFHRPRPFRADPTLTPVCDRATTDSYPSGHAMVGYLEAFALAQMLPDRSSSILRRADNFAHNRLICGVHYPSDIAASHVIAAAIFAGLMNQRRFRQELAVAKREIQDHFKN